LFSRSASTIDVALRTRQSAYRSGAAGTLVEAIEANRGEHSGGEFGELLIELAHGFDNDIAVLTLACSHPRLNVARPPQ
jgi:hypothetical protein